MGIRSLLGKPFAKYIASQTRKWASKPRDSQEKVFNKLVRKAADTAFGRDHNFSEIKSYEDFKANVPIRDYEQLKPYVERMVAGEKDVLWPGKPIYLSKTSGTTSGVKYIPITKDSIPNHFVSARNAVLEYVAETGKGDFLDGKLIFLSGSPELNKKKIRNKVEHYPIGTEVVYNLPPTEARCNNEREVCVTLLSSFY